jgi:hypothetical protein
MTLSFLYLNFVCNICEMRLVSDEVRLPVAVMQTLLGVNVELLIMQVSFIQRDRLT